MKAVAVVPGKRQVQLIEQEPPPLASPTAVRLRMLEVGVCGTDREICAFQYGTPPAGSEHLVIGHESLGQVVEVGPEVTRLARGDLVVTMVRRPCPHAECGACRRAVVLGAGPVGLLGAMALAAAGYDTAVYSRERAPNPKADLVAAIGGHYYSAEETPIERLAEQVGNIDLVYEATGASSIAFQVMEVIGTNGIFVFTGVPGRKAPIEVDTDVIMRNLVLKNQVVFGTVNAGQEAFEAAIRDLTVFQQRWPAAVRALITGRYPVEAHRDLLVGPAQGIKNVITFA